MGFSIFNDKNAQQKIGIKIRCVSSLFFTLLSDNKLHRYKAKDYSENKVSVTLSNKGKDNLNGSDFDTVHVKESLNEEGNIVYNVQPIEASMADVIETVPYEYKWTETVTKYKYVDVSADANTIKVLSVILMTVWQAPLIAILSPILVPLSTDLHST